MTILQIIGCLIFNLRQYSVILQNKEDKNLILNRIIYSILMTYALITSPKFFIVFTVIKSIYDIIILLIKVEASGVLTEKYKVSLIDDLISLIAFIVYVGG